MAEGNTTTTTDQTKTDNKQPDLASLQKELEDLKAEKAKWTASNKQQLDDPGLRDKAQQQQADKDKLAAESKALEAALSFTLTAKDFLKQNESLFPKSFKDILDVSDKEKYDSAINKSNAIKSAWIQEYFSQQSNVDSLTESQKNALADYQKLTKNGKEEKAHTIWENIFEPSVEMTKRVKKAEELAQSRSGFGGNTDSEQAYKNKLMDMAKKKFFGG